MIKVFGWRNFDRNKEISIRNGIMKVKQDSC